MGYLSNTRRSRDCVDTHSHWVFVHGGYLVMKDDFFKPCRLAVNNHLRALPVLALEPFGH